MGLFDDILKKPNSPTGQQVNPPTDPLMSSAPMGGQQGSTQSGAQGGSGTSTTPTIIKTTASTVFGPSNETEMTPFQNSSPKVHAEEDSSSVIVSSIQQGIAPTTPIAPIAPIQEPMIVTPLVEPATNQVQSPSLIPEGNSTPEPTLIQQEPEVSSQKSSSPDSPQPSDALNIPQGPSLFDHIMSDDEPKVPAESPVVAPAAFNFEAPNPLVKSSSEELPEDIEAPVSVKKPLSSSSMTSQAHYSTPREFIEKSLENIEAMLETIDKRHNSKMTEAEGYRMEKMRFAELEKNAYAEAEIMDRERDHTLRMKTIFEKELDTDEANRTRKSSSHQEAYTEKHTAHPHGTHKHSSQETEDNLIAAS
ncbi:MAG: hypothetical protein HHAS10_05740 [Candidatus Altimarinota bacterium]